MNMRNRHPGGRPATSRDVRVLAQRRPLDHRALARVVLSLLARLEAADSSKATNTTTSRGGDDEDA